MFRNIIIGAGIAAALFTVFIFSGNSSFGKSGISGPTGQVVVWGTIPNTNVLTFLQMYNPAVKTYRVDYVEIKEEEFASKLLDALASGAGPDVIIAPYQIIISQISKIQPLPIATISEKLYKDTFVNGTSLFWTPYGAMALPVSIEPLMLFYNRSILSKNGIVNPPAYWGEVKDMIPKLASVDKTGKFENVAISLGTFDNIPYAKDIIMNIVYQLKQTPVTVSFTDRGPSYKVSIDDAVDKNGEVKPLTTAVRFWTDFANQDKPATYTWNSFMPDPHGLFLGEKLAMYIGYSSENNQIKQENQKIDFGMSPIPQAKDYDTFSTGMRLYGMAILKSNKNPLASIFAVTSFASTYSNDIANMVGGLTPIKENLINKDPSKGVVLNLDEGLVKSVLNARGFYDIYQSKTTDMFSKMINDILTGKSLVVESVSSFVIKFARLYGN